MPARRTARCAAVLTVVLVVLAGCSSSESSTPTGPIVSGTLAGPDNNCLDDPGTVSGTLREWYSDIYNGMLSFDAPWQQTVSDRGDAIEQVIDQAVIDLLPGFEAIGIGERIDTDGTCVTVRGITYDRADGARVVVTIWRPGRLGERLGVPMVAPPTDVDDSSLAVESAHFTTALAVADDGTSVLLIAYGAFQQTRMQGWPTTMMAPTNMPAPGPTPATADQAVAIAAAVLAAALDR